ncbi:MAG: DUF362 domain-containing protein [Thermodesulfovibrionales bacterium]|jgi:uncharacterized protein (DUF362 family)|nr:DUF362 domain-containing protein [Thermodesulfovibrionales bacterium]
MHRREFIKSAAITAAGLSMPTFIGTFIDNIEAADKTDLAVAHGASPSKITRAAIDAMGGIKKFISRGDIVVIKPNMAWDRTPEQAANTNPEVVVEVVKMCYEAGAKKVKVFDRTVNDPRRCYVQSGIADAVRVLGAEVSYVDERKFKDMDIKGEAMKSWPLYTDIFEADKVINIPVAKHHSLAKLTMSMKNWMGVMGGSRRQIHQKLDESLVDLSMFIKPTLTILDAVRILTANGPQGGNLADVKKLDTVIAGVDQVAIDSFGATLFGIKGSDLGYVRMADQRGLGTMDIAKLKIRKINV